MVGTGPLVRLSRGGRPDLDAAHGHAPGPGVGQADPGLLDCLDRRSARCLVACCASLFTSSGPRSAIARTIRRFGRSLDTLVLVGIHLALALGLAVGFFLQQKGFLPLVMPAPARKPSSPGAKGSSTACGSARPTWGMSSWLRVAVLLLVRVVRRPRPPALLDRPAQHLRVQPADVGSLGGHHGLPAGAGLHPLVPPAPSSRPRWAGSTWARSCLLCSVLLTVMVTILTPLSPADRHPAADDLHGRLEAGPPARADLGPDDRLHGARDGPGRRLRRDQPGLPLADRRQHDQRDRSRWRSRRRKRTA